MTQSYWLGSKCFVFPLVLCPDNKLARMVSGP